MYYYNLDNDKVRLYKINIDRLKLLEIRKKAIQNSSEIKHITTETTEIPEENEQLYNLEYKMIGKKYDDFTNKNRNLYLVEYDWYEFPKLVYIIDELLNENTSIIDELYNNINYINNQENEINELYNELRKAHQIKDNKLIKKINGRIIGIKKCREKNPLQDYYLEVYKCIEFKKVRSLSINTLMRTEEFFKETNAPILTASKILKKERIKRLSEENSPK